MKILIVTQIYLPEMGALANRLYPIVRELVAKGHDVTVATGMPSYPAGKVFPDYRGRLFMRETKDGYTILRTAYVTTPRNKSKALQLVSYLSFIPAVLVSGLRAGRFDVVFITAPPPFPIISAIQLARLRGAKLVMDVRDLWSDELISYCGMREGSTPVRVVRQIERWGYRSADLVTCTTNSLIDTVVERGANRNRTMLLPNGADLEFFRRLPVSAEADRYGFGNRFVVMYSGLFGIKHGLEVLLDAARMLRNRNDIVFFLLGNGARRDALLKKIRDESINNVIIGNECSVEEVPKITARSGVCFAATQAEPYAEKLISVKIFEYMACEKPVIGSVVGESARVIHESGAGIVVSPGDAHAVADAVVRLHKNTKLRKQMGKAGRRYVEQRYSRAAWAAQLCQSLENLVIEGQNASGLSYAEAAAVPPET